ncbi:hypothetical protein ACPCTO_25880 [Streptomyces olivoreticuli]
MDTRSLRRQQRSISHENDPTWWKGPRTASLVDVPFLVWDYLLDHGQGYVEYVIVPCGLLLLIAWMLPHRQSLRKYRTVVAGLAAGLTASPIWVLVLLLAAMGWGIV